MAATTITTIEDLMRVLDENPEWLEALRTRLLTRELIELPRRFAEFAASVDQRFNEQGESITRLEQTVGEHRAEFVEFAASVDQRFNEQGEAIARLEQTVNEHSAEFVEVRRQLQLVRDDVGDLKGPRAEDAAAEDIEFIAEQLGLAFTRILTRDDLIEMLRAQPLPDLTGGVRHSFTKADIVAETARASGETRYIAVEASYTVNGRDTDRALRNAEILTRLTGKPAQAVVAGYRLDDRTRARIESGEAHWHELEH